MSLLSYFFGKKTKEQIVKDRTKAVSKMKLDIPFSIIPKMTFKEVKREVRKRGKITTVIRVRDYNAMLGLMAINLDEEKLKWLEPDEESESCNEFHHWFCINEKDSLKRAFRLENNYYQITIIEAEHGDTDMGSQFGPNHDGLGITKIKRLFPIKNL